MADKNMIEILESIKKEVETRVLQYNLSEESYSEGKVVWSEYLISTDGVFEIIDKHISELQEVTQ